MKSLTLLILLIPVATAITVDFDCPDEVKQNEELICSLEIFDAEGFWDFKFNLEKDGETIAKIWNAEKDSWSSAYYYLNEFVEEGEEKEVRIIIGSEGKFKDVIKLRQGSKREFFDFEIKVEENEESENSQKEDSLTDMTAKSEEESSEKISEQNTLKEKTTIALSGNSIKQEEIVYESKDNRILNLLPYAFSIFLIVIILILIWEKF